MHPEQPATADVGVGSLDFGLIGRGADAQRALAHARACFPDGTDGQQRLLALHLAAIFALDDALESGRPLGSAPDEQRTLLPWIEPPSNGEDAELLASRTAIRAAIAYVDRQLAAMALAEPRLDPRPLSDELPPPESAIQWWRKQGELMVAAVWQEAQWRISGSLPDESSYLAVAEISIGIRWIVATLLMLDGARLAPLRGGPVVTTTAAVAVAIRIANDLHETRRERREGKVQLLFLRIRALQALGYSKSLAERRARRELQSILCQRVARARALLDETHWSASPRLRSGLHGMLSTALELIHTPEFGAARAMTAAAQQRS